MSRGSRHFVVLLLIIGFVCLAWPRRWYNDDCFITFRYSQHIAAGHGYVWNAPEGERIEGGTSLSWTLLNAGAVTLGLEPVGFSQVLGLLAASAGLLVIYLASGPGSFALFAVLVLVAQRQWVLWSVSGQEMKLATVLGFAATVLLTREMTEGQRGHHSGVVFLLATLTRPEMPLLHVAAAAGVLLFHSDRTRLLVVLRSGAIHAIGLLIVTGLRLVYFGQALPNPVYAKVGGAQFHLGFTYLYQMARQNHAEAWVTVIAAGLLLGLLRAPLSRALLMQAVAWCAWLAWQGGGRWEFRFLDPLLPGIAVLLAASLALIDRQLASRLTKYPRVAATLGIGAMVLFASWLPLFRPFHPTAVLESSQHQKVVTDIFRGDAEALAPYLDRDARIAIGWAGVLPYVTDAWHFDPWGLNDNEIARRPFDLTAPLFHQRHAEWTDMSDRAVMFVDVYNRFLHSAPARPAELRADANPWIEDGVPIYCVELPVDRKFRYWIFASPWSRDAVESWLDQRGLWPLWVEPYRTWRNDREQP